MISTGLLLHFMMKKHHVAPCEFELFDAAFISIWIFSNSVKSPSLLSPEAFTLGMTMFLFSLLELKFQTIIDGSRVSRNLQRTSHQPRHPLELRWPPTVYPTVLAKGTGLLCQGRSGPAGPWPFSSRCILRRGLSQESTELEQECNRRDTIPKATQKPWLKFLGN